MNDSPPEQRVENAAKRMHTFDAVVLVLQGGGALGAYQAGVFQALHEAGIQLRWLCATSIGAINGALIVGNPPEQQVGRLREFWEAITKPPIKFPMLPWLSDLPWAGDERMRAWTNKMSAFAAMVHGAPGFFTPRAAPPLNSAAERPDLVSYYDTSPLQATLTRLVDFELINSKPLRLSVGATNVRTGASVYFDNIERSLRAEHIMASAALPPGFPPVEIDGEYYWDGGVVSNSPIQVVVDTRGGVQSALVFQVDLWDANGEVPLDVTSANLRAMEIHSASRINVSIEQYRKMRQYRHAIGWLLDHLPEEYRNNPNVQLLGAEAYPPIATLVQLKYQAKTYETAGKIFEFSRRAMEEHWQAGYEDTQIALREPAVLELPDTSEGVRIFDVHYGWIT